MAAQALGAARDQASITPPGKIVQAADIDGVFSDMHIYCLDNDDDDYDVSGLPLVLLESALNAPGEMRVYMPMCVCVADGCDRVGGVGQCAAAAGARGACLLL